MYYVGVYVRMYACMHVCMYGVYVGECVRARARACVELHKFSTNLAVTSKFQPSPG